MITIKLDELISALAPAEKQALEQAANYCVARAGSEILVEDYLLALLDGSDSFLNKVLLQFSLSADTLRTILLESVGYQKTESRNPVFSTLLVNWLEEAFLITKLQLQQSSIACLALLLAIQDRPEKYARTRYGQFFSDIPREKLMALMDGLQAEVLSAMSVSGAGSALQQFTKSYTQLARDGKLDPVLCRDEEIRQIVDILSRRRKNNPILVGEAGVGKTAVVEGLAQHVIAGLVPPALTGIELLELDMGLLQAGASVKGEFERRLKAVIDEVNASPKPIVLFIDEAHTLIGAGGQAGGGDAANLLKPALARGTLRTLAATTWSEYKKYFEKDPALARRFQPVQVLEPTITQATTILRGLVSRYEVAHDVYLRDDAVVTAAELSARYLSGRQLPDKAIDLLDTACARVKNSQHATPIRLQAIATSLAEKQRLQTALLRDQQHGLPVEPGQLAALERQIPQLEQEHAELSAHWQEQKTLVAQLVASRNPEVSSLLSAADNQSEITAELVDVDVEAPETVLAALAELQQSQGILIHHEVTPQVVAEVISSWTAIPVENLIEAPSARVVEFADRLRARIRGQAHAVSLIERAVKATAAGLGNPLAPTGVFLLAGPSGVGKTETAVAVAELLYGGERFLTTINMSEFQEKHSLSRLIGSPPGYVGYGEGGILTEAVRQRPYSVILLDEVEKADPDILNLFYQIFDKGIANDGEGRVINFRNTLIFMTSNLASAEISSLAAGETPVMTDSITETIRPVLAKHFKPALLARMNIIPYLPIANDVMHELVLLRLQKLSQRIASRGIALTFDAAVVTAIAESCTRTDTGARNIDFLVNNYLLPAISDRILKALTQQENIRGIRVVQDEYGNFELIIG
ncbi:type VI secretion ATPase, ClpV1 family [Tolumonas auensis DSM 9187]|uniref:Type VI secretion ATPase, ClpV1 family n=1 Tax=Tolumonas auensis (strain DSM 9187 / NBRC 110442 / TA 4) TaxID=595494 RepID=C4L830_TOLAT|nr:type VI secretion system ATPase TssH [Tolumonas auensis]ACQ91829.1 type VI secretion ATPase, ClpV1 family [Tolumonas auensis DSM 9187]